METRWYHGSEADKDAVDIITNGKRTRITQEQAFGMCCYPGPYGDAQQRDDETLDECIGRLSGIPVQRDEAGKVIS